MSGRYEPPRGFLSALTTLDVGEADVIVTPDKQAADWAREHGYSVSDGEMAGTTIFEIQPGGASDPTQVG